MKMIIVLSIEQKKRLIRTNKQQKKGILILYHNKTKKIHGMIYSIFGFVKRIRVSEIDLKTLFVQIVALRYVNNYIV